MKKQYLEIKGNITLFLCLIFTILLLLIMLILESSRIHTVKAHTEGVSHMAIESVMGHFSLSLFENYGLFAVNMADSSISPLLEEYINCNLSPASDLTGAYYNLCKISSHTCTPFNIYHMTDDNGKIFINQLLQYMSRYPAATAADILLTSPYINILSKDYVDISNINTEETQIDTSFSLSDFSNDVAQETALTEEEALSKRDSIYNNIKTLLTQTSLSIYIDKSSDISVRKADTTMLPSAVCSYSHDSSVIKDLSPSEKILLLLYISNHFNCYTSNESDNAELKYQLEYLIHGSPNDDTNLLKCILNIQSLRTGLNLAYLYTDTEKRQEARTLAQAAVGLIQVPFIVEFTQLAILSAWSSAEAIADVRSLLKGNKIPIFKSKSSWTLNLQDLFTFHGSTISKNSNTGFTYNQYLQLYLYTGLSTDIVYRTMDLIQMDIKKNYNSAFKMNECITGLKYKFSYNYNPVFSINHSLYGKNSILNHSFIQSYGY